MPVEDRVPVEQADVADLLTHDVDLESLRSLRDEATACGATHGLSDLVLIKFVIAVYEVAANAVRHGGGTGRVRVWRAGDSLWCEVIDHGRGIPAVYRRSGPRPRGERISGWGLWLTRQVCAEVHISSSRAGSTVRLRYLLTDAAA